jgi:hypothetical protein
LQNRKLRAADRGELEIAMIEVTVKEGAYRIRVGGEESQMTTGETRQFDNPVTEFRKLGLGDATAPESPSASGASE